MTLSVSQLSNAKEATNDLLEALGLQAYRFEVEPENGQWLVRVECAVDEGWMSTNFSVEYDLLQQSREDSAVRERLLQSWREHLASCQTAT